MCVAVERERHTDTRFTESSAHGNTLQHTATHCNTLQHTLPSKVQTCSSHRETGKSYTHDPVKYTVQYTATHCKTLQRTVTHCNTLQHTATHCNIHCQVKCRHAGSHRETGKSYIRYTATHCNTLQRTATHCNALQRTATHCNALQHTLPSKVQTCSRP